MINPFKLAALAAVFVAVPAAGEIVTYPIPEGVEKNATFSVEVSEDGNMWLPVEVYNVKVDEVVDARHTIKDSSMAYFDCDGEVKLRVVSNRQSVATARVRPLSKGIVPEVKGDTLLFSAKPGNLLSVEVNNDIFNNLQLFVNAPDANAPDPKQLKKLRKNKDYLYYGPGVHEFDSLVVRSGQTLYVAGGAVLTGRVFVSDAENAKIVGRGMIYPRNKMGILVARSSNVEVEGVFTTQCAVGESHDVTVHNVKVMSAYGWGDGFNVFASRNVRYDGVFARTSDDCTTIYCTRLGHKGSSTDIKMENSVLWADVAHPITIGLHGNSEQPDSVCNALYRNIDVLDMKEKQIDYQGVFAINAGDNNLVKNIRFEDIRVENFRQGKLIDLRVCYNKKYCTAPGRGIEDIYFKDIIYNGDHSELSLIIGYDETRKVKNVVFDNLVINGEKVYDEMPGKPKWYKTGDMGRIFIGEHVENVSFK